MPTLSVSNAAIEKAAERLKSGQMVLLVDDEDRENEGDLVMAAEFATPIAINFMATHARGLICVPMEADRVDSLKLPMMSANNGTAHKTAFTVSVEAKENVTTGISAADRAQTVRVLADYTKGASDLVTPGHIFPLRAMEGGVLVRTGHTEGSVDLCKIAGLKAAAVICEIMNEDGSMARLPELQKFSEKHGIPLVSIKDLVAYRMERESLVERVATTKLPSEFSNNEFTLHAYQSKIDGSEHLALVRGNLENPALVRVHSECLTGDALGSLRCDCGPQLRAAMKQIDESGNGVLVYMRKHEGRGIGLLNKIKAYSLQDQGMDTIEANRHLGFGMDLRHYGIGAQILRHLGLREIKLLTNNPKKIVGLDGYGIKVVEQVSIQIASNPHNEKYLNTKRDRMGHLLTSNSGEKL